jgi:hypothetical protein
MPERPETDAGHRRTWLTEERDPDDPVGRKGHPFLEEPNYYRMAYQLAVELIEPRRVVRKTILVDEDGPTERDPTAREPDPEPRDPDPQATAIVRRLIDDANLMLRWYEERENHGIGQFWKRLDDRQKALRSFLEKTLLPCLEILRAEIDPRPCDGVDAALERRREEADARRLAYRPLYNLASHEAGKERCGSNQNEARSLPRAEKLLLEAISKAPTSRQAALLARAENDTALAALFESEEFRSRLAVSSPVVQGLSPTPGPPR